MQHIKFYYEVWRPALFCQGWARVEAFVETATSAQAIRNRIYGRYKHHDFKKRVVVHKLDRRCKADRQCLRYYATNFMTRPRVSFQLNQGKLKVIYKGIHKQLV